MAVRFICNAFSLNMLSEMTANIRCEEISATRAAEIIMTEDVDSAVGHFDTAEVFGSDLGIQITTKRNTVTLNKGDSIIVGQYSGPRLPEGACVLPEGAVIRWVLVTIE